MKNRLGRTNRSPVALQRPKAIVYVRIAILLTIVLAFTMFTISVQEAAADVLPRVRCQLSKTLYMYGEPIVFYLDIDIFPNTTLAEMIYEESRPDGSVKTVSFGMLQQGSYQLIIDQAGPPQGYRQCTLRSRRAGASLDLARWQGGYVVQAGALTSPTPSPVSPLFPTQTPGEPLTPTQTPERTPITIQPITPVARTDMERSLLPVFALLVLVIVATVVYRNARSKQ